MPATLYFDPAILKLPEAGETFEIAINARDIDDLQSFTLFVRYDSETLKVLRRTLINNLTPLDHFIPGDPDILIVTFRNQPLLGGVADDATLAVITFEVLSQEASTIEITESSTLELTTGIVFPEKEAAELTVTYSTEDETAALANSRNRFRSIAFAAPPPPAPRIILACIDIEEPVILAHGDEKDVSFKYKTGYPSSSKFDLRWYFTEADADTNINEIFSNLPVTDITPTAPFPIEDEELEGILKINAVNKITKTTEYYPQIIIVQEVDNIGILTDVLKR